MLFRHRTSSVHRLLRLILLCLITFILCLAHFPITSWLLDSDEVVIAQTYVVINTSNQSRENYDVTNLQNAIKKWKLELSLQMRQQNFTEAAILVEKIAKADYFLGENEQAIKYWQQAELLYRQIKDFSGLGQSFIGKAQAYRSLGKANKAMALARRALHIARIYEDKNLEIAALGSRGEAYHLQRKYKLAIADFHAGLNLASRINNSYNKICLLNSLGRVYISLARVNYRRVNSSLELGDKHEVERWSKKAYSYDIYALIALQQSYQLAKKNDDKQLQINSIISAIPSVSRIYQSNIVRTKLQEAVLITSSLPDSHFKAYTLIKLAQLAKSLPIRINLSISSCSQSIEYKQLITSIRLLNQAIAIARALKSDDILALAFGNIGHIYECRQQYRQALILTRKAKFIIKKKSKSEKNIYIWEWQEARILKALNQPKRAIKSYEIAINYLENNLRNIVFLNRYLQLDFSQNIELIYRQLIELKLSLINSSNFKLDRNQNNSAIWSNIMPMIEKIKLIEMQKYFGVDSSPKSINTKKSILLKYNRKTAIFCSIIFQNRTAIITTFPNGTSKLHWINIDSKYLKKEINEFRIGLERRSQLIYNTHQAQKIYDWIIAPFIDNLNSQKITTLVFINDGILRAVPMAALHDGNKFVIEKYSVANIPSLSLTDTSKIKQNQPQALNAGLTENAIINGKVYQALDHVAEEIKQISEIFADSKQLLNEYFTRKHLEAELQKTLYPIIHIATHAEFSHAVGDTFLITGNNEKLTIKELDRLIRNVVTKNNSVELLTLTACETAAGDETAALGLAGVAVEAGVKSTLASLWSINDAATVDLITKFYQEWYINQLSKAEALHKAQQQMISQGGKYAHPYYWAPFVLIGNWL